MKKILLSILLLFMPSMLNLAYALPKQIVIVRHGDKLLQPDPGPTLSPKGQMRAIALAIYYSKKFGDPDYIIAATPEKIEAGRGASIREIQTIAPLANMVAAKHPRMNFPILHPYSSEEYLKLADELLKNKQFNGKTIIVCWDHKLIPQLAKALGVTETLKKWPGKDFDSVFVLEYNQDKVNFTHLKNQYPVAFNGSWEKIYDTVN